MNAITTQEIAILSLPERAAVALGAAPNEVKLRELVTHSASILAIKNKAGRDECHTAYMALKNTRCTIVNLADDATEDAKKFTKAVKIESARLIAITEAEETRLQSLRDEWDAFEAAAKQQKIEAEMARVKVIHTRIMAMRACASMCAGETPGAIKNRIAVIEEIDCDDPQEGFSEFAHDAKDARQEALAIMRQALDKSIAYYAEAAKLAADREELRLLQVAQAQQAAQFAEAQRLAKVEADRVAANQELMRQTNITTAMLLSEEQAAHAAEVKRAADALSEQQAAADARDAAAAKQAVIDAAHGEGLAMDVEFDVLITGMNDAFADQVEADHAAALIHNAWYDAETSRLFAAIPVVAIETVPALDIAALADTAGDEPATDAEIIAELLSALIACAEAMENIDGASYGMTLAMIGAGRAIARAEGRAA